MIMAFARVGDEGAPALETDLLDCHAGVTIAPATTALVAPAEYVEVVARLARLAALLIGHANLRRS